MTSGPVMLDLDGLSLSEEERDLLIHPNVGGVILFSRNYESPEQVAALVTAIHEAGGRRLIVGVDQEGGRVQRFREGFTWLPPLRRLGDVFDVDPAEARRLARLSGWLMASEVRATGVDFSFAPVLDLDRGVSEVIGDRALHSDPQVVADLGKAYARGMREAGMAATVKHFPGHGGVAADSHHALPVDGRSFEDIRTCDLMPFERMVRHGVAAVMPAHVCYPCVDEAPAGFSRVWLQAVLRGQLGFQGAIFSDDLAMGAAAIGGGFSDRAQCALDAGCDVILVCNHRSGAVEVVEALTVETDPVAALRRARMHGRRGVSREALKEDPRWSEAVTAVARYGEGESLELAL